METNLVIRFNIPGFHYWPGASDQYSYLENRHRHVFWFEVELNTEDSNDRPIEFIELKNKLIELAYNMFDACSDLSTHLEFNDRSCETIARELGEEILISRGLKLHYVSVLEDNENGARVYFNDM